MTKEDVMKNIKRLPNLNWALGLRGCNPGCLCYLCVSPVCFVCPDCIYDKITINCPDCIRVSKEVDNERSKKIR